MSALGGGVPKKQMIVLKSCVNVTVTRGEGVQKFQKFCGRHLSIVPNALAVLPSTNPEDIRYMFTFRVVPIAIGRNIV